MVDTERKVQMRTLAILAFLGLVVAACSPSDVADKVVENAVESQDGDVDVDIDSDDGSITVKGEDGEVATFGGGDLPDDLPIPLPDGGEVQQVIATNDGNSVTLWYPADDFDSIADFFKGIYETESAGDENRFDAVSSNPKSANYGWNTPSGGLRTISVTQVAEQTLVTVIYGDN